MSALVKQFLPAQLLYQPGRKRKTASAIPQARAGKRTSPVEPEVRLWKLCTRAASDERCIIGLAVLVLLLVIATADVIYGFAELNHLLQTDAVQQVVAKAINLD